MDRSLDYCWFSSFSPVSLERLDFGVRLRQVHTNPSARLLLAWHNLKVFAARRSERTQNYVSVDAFHWRPIHGHRLFPNPAPPIFTYYCSLTYDFRYLPLLRAMALKGFGTCLFL